GKAEAGLAHGRAGVGFALARWAEATGANRYRAATAKLMRFDLETKEVRAQSSLQRTSPVEIGSSLGWCCGWVGVGLAALRSAPNSIKIGTKDKARFRHIADEIIDFGVEGPLCLCHGALGRMEY